MQVLQATNDLCCVVDRTGFWEAGVLLIHIVDVVPEDRTPWEARTRASGQYNAETESPDFRAHTYQHSMVTLGPGITVPLEKP